MKTFEASELTEHINEILRLVEEGEIIALTDHDKVFAHIVPTLTSIQHKQTKQDAEAFWARTESLATEIGSYLTEKVDINDIMRDIRGD